MSGTGLRNQSMKLLCDHLMCFNCARVLIRKYPPATTVPRKVIIYSIKKTIFDNL